MSHSVAGFGAIEMRSWGDPSARTSKCRRSGWHIGGSDSSCQGDFSRRFLTCGGVDNASRRTHATMAHGSAIARRRAIFPGSRFLLAQLLAIGRAAAHGVALIPRQKLVRRPAMV